MASYQEYSYPTIRQQVIKPVQICQVILLMPNDYICYSCYITKINEISTILRSAHLTNI